MEAVQSLAILTSPRAKKEFVPIAASSAATRLKS